MILWFLIGFISCFLTFFFVGLYVKKKENKYKKEIIKLVNKLPVDDILKQLKDNFNNARNNIDNKYMEEQLKLKLETEQKLKDIDKETLEKIKNNC